MPLSQTKLIARHNDILASIIHQANIPADRLRQAMHYSLFPGGKRIRPLLVYLSGALLNISTEICDWLAAAIELTHTYSLIHDDLPAMDNDDYRRGKASCHRAFDEATAILAGDALQALAIEILANNLNQHLDCNKTLNVIKALVQASGPSGMISGQSLDLTELTQNNLSLEALSQVHELKTGRMLLACIQMPLAATNTTAASHNALLSFGQHLGLVFQMHDDYLDRFGPSALGKGRSSDSANNKFTFADKYSQKALWALLKVHYEQAIDALSCFGTQAEPLQKMILALQNRA